MQGSRTHILETNHVPREYIVAAILSSLFMVPLCLFPALVLLFFYVSTFRSMCSVPNMAVFCSALTSWFPGMSLTYFLNDLEMVSVAPLLLLLLLLLLCALMKVTGLYLVNNCLNYAVIRIIRVRITMMRINEFRITGGTTVLQGFAFGKFAMYRMTSRGLKTNFVRSVSEKMLRNYVFEAWNSSSQYLKI